MRKYLLQLIFRSFTILKSVAEVLILLCWKIELEYFSIFFQYFHRKQTPIGIFILFEKTVVLVPTSVPRGPVLRTFYANSKEYYEKKILAIRNFLFRTLPL